MVCQAIFHLNFKGFLDTPFFFSEANIRFEKACRRFSVYRKTEAEENPPSEWRVIPVFLNDVFAKRPLLPIFVFPLNPPYRQRSREYDNEEYTDKPESYHSRFWWNTVNKPANV